MMKDSRKKAFNIMMIMTILLFLCVICYFIYHYFNSNVEKENTNNEIVTEETINDTSDSTSVEKQDPIEMENNEESQEEIIIEGEEKGNGNKNDGNNNNVNNNSFSNSNNTTANNDTYTNNKKAEETHQQPSCVGKPEFSWEEVTHLTETECMNDVEDSINGGGCMEVIDCMGNTLGWMIELY